MEEVESESKVSAECKKFYNGDIDNKGSLDFLLPSNGGYKPMKNNPFF